MRTDRESITIVLMNLFLLTTVQLVMPPMLPKGVKNANGKPTTPPRLHPRWEALS